MKMGQNRYNTNLLKIIAFYYVTTHNVLRCIRSRILYLIDTQIIYKVITKFDRVRRQVL